MSFHFNLSSSEDEDEFDDDPRESSAVAASISGGGRSGAEEILVEESSRFSSTAEASSSPPFASSRISAGTFAWGDESDDDDDEGVDWEDADEGDGNESCDGSSDQDATPGDSSLVGVHVGSKRRIPTRDITIDFGGDEKKQEKEDDNKEGKQKTKRRRKRLNKIQNLPPQLARLVLNIHRSHMLTLSGRAVFVSHCCSNDELLHLAHSLIPADIMDSCFNCTQANEPIIPSEVQVRQVLAWFFDLGHDISQRRRRIRENNAALGAPQQQPRQRAARRGRRGRSDGRGNRGRWGATHKTKNDKYLNEGVGSTDVRRLMALLQYLSPTNEEDPAFDDEEQRDAIGGAATSHEKTQILILVLRSLGWRVRYVTAMQPVTRELTVNHPLFATSLKDVFHRVMAGGSNHTLQKKAKSLKKKRSTTQNSDRTECAEAAQGSGSILAWGEILFMPATRCKRPSTVAANGEEGKGGGSSAARWIHVDVERRVVDQPSFVETLLARLKDDRLESTSEKSFRGSGARSKARVSYVFAVEHTNLESTTDNTHGSTSMHAFCRLTDVTRRYSGAWSETLRLRGATGQQIVSSGGKCADSWWANTVRKTNRLAKRQARNFLSQQLDKAKEDNEKKMSPRVASSKGGSDSCEAIVIDDSSDSEGEGNATASAASALVDEDAHADVEKAELAASAADEAIPTSKAAFKKHPLYAIPSILNNAEVIDPSGKKRVVGMFKGELIYRRADVCTALTAKKWLYQGRKVKDAEVPKPAKKVKARQKPASKTFKALTSYGVSDNTEQKIDDASIDKEYDGMDKLYGKWQTDQWSPPPVGPNDAIPVNEYKNVERALLNPGLVHLELTRISQVAKKLGIPYAPCLLGFEGHGGNRTPTIRGIVVHEHNADLLREAHTEWESQAVEQEHEQRRRAVYKRWKRLIVGVLTKERLERQYGDANN